MKVRIEAVISTAGNDEAYVGHHLGLATIGRPLKKMVVTFEEDISREELKSFLKVDADQLVKSFVMGANAIQLHSFSLQVMPIQ
jgi:hypothetical protein